MGRDTTEWSEVWWSRGEGEGEGLDGRGGTDLQTPLRPFTVAHAAHLQSDALNPYHPFDTRYKNTVGLGFGGGLDVSGGCTGRAPCPSTPIWARELPGSYQVHRPDDEGGQVPGIGPAEEKVCDLIGSSEKSKRSTERSTEIPCVRSDERALDADM